MQRESVGILEQLFARLVRELGESGAESIVRVFAEEIGGVRIVFPDLKTLERMARDRQICRRFDGRNFEELALRYQLSSAQIRRILIRGQSS